MSTITPQIEVSLGRLLCHGQLIAGWVDGIAPEMVP